MYLLMAMSDCSFQIVHVYIFTGCLHILSAVLSGLFCSLCLFGVFFFSFDFVLLLVFVPSDGVSFLILHNETALIRNNFFGAV